MTERKGADAVNDAYELLTEKEAMWAGMLMQVLDTNGISCTATPVNGAALSMSMGTQDWMRVYVPHAQMEAARALLAQLFSE